MNENQARIITPFKTGTYRLEGGPGTMGSRIVRILDCVVAKSDTSGPDTVFLKSEVHPISLTSTEDSFHLTLYAEGEKHTATVTLGKVHRIITVVAPETKEAYNIQMIVEVLVPPVQETIDEPAKSLVDELLQRNETQFIPSDSYPPPPTQEKENMSRSIPLAVKVSVVGVLLFCLGIWALVAFERVTVESGTEALILERPYFFGDSGLQKETLKPGSHWIWSTSIVIPMVTVPEQHPEQIIDAATKENNFLDYDTTAVVQVLDVYALYSKFRENWYAINVQKQYQSVVRAAIKGYKFDDIMTNAATTTEIENKIITTMNAYITEKQLPIAFVDVSIGRAKPDPKVAEEMARTAGEAQRLKTLINTTAAENQRKESEIARANADNAYRLAMNLSVNDFVELRVAQLYSEACAKGMSCYINAGGIPLVVK